MLELQTLESIVKNAPEESWDTFNNERYYKRCSYRWSVWLKNTAVWSVPICNPPVDFRNRKDIEKQIDQLKEIEGLNLRLQQEDSIYVLMSESLTARTLEVESLREQLATANLEATRKGFWLGFEDARCNPQENNILMQWENTLIFTQSKQLRSKD